jgi:hypothetical protein
MSRVHDSRIRVSIRYLPCVPRDRIGPLHLGDCAKRVVVFDVVPARVVSKECLPALRRRRPTPHHVFGDRRLGKAVFCV